MGLEVNNLKVSINDKIIIKEATLKVGYEEKILLVGPNGSGKTSLIQAIIGNPRYRVDGRILLDGKDISNIPMHERVLLGLAASYQIPPSLRGLTLYDLAYNIMKRFHDDIDIIKERIYSLASSLNMVEFLDREVNREFSGGELKRSELFLTLLLKPKIILLDEIDSGVDMENLRIMAKEIMRYYKRYKPGILFVTHTGGILRFLKSDRLYILLDGFIRESRDVENAFNIIMESGFYKFI